MSTAGIGTLEVAVECPSWEWAEVDGARLVWAEYGKLFSGRLDANGLIDVNELFGNTLQYEGDRSSLLKVELSAWRLSITIETRMAFSMTSQERQI